MTFTVELQCRPCGQPFTASGEDIKRSPCIDRLGVPCHAARDQARHEAAMAEGRRMLRELTVDESSKAAA